MFLYFFAGYIDAQDTLTRLYIIFNFKIKKNRLTPDLFFLLDDRRALKCPTEINQMNQIN